MPRFTATISFDLETEVEPEGVRFDRWLPNGVTELEDESYFQRTEVRSDGGNVTCVIEADTQEDAESIASEIISEGNEVEDDNGLTWIIYNPSWDLEEIEEPMTLELAKKILAGLVVNTEGERGPEAVEFIFGYIEGLDRRVNDLVAQVARLTEGTGAIGRAERFVATGDTEVLTEGLPEASDGGDETTA